MPYKQTDQEICSLKKKKHQAKNNFAFSKRCVIFKAENKAMKTASTYPLSISAPNKLFACLVVCMIKYLYNTDIQVITPPPT